jgi:transcriptional regulator with XRE-family HTH domain
MYTKVNRINVTFVKTVFSMEDRLLKLEDRLLKLLDTEQLSSSKFADVIGVQRSSVSHILTGRNKPSFDFLQKTLKAFPMLNADWLILSEGEMYEGERGPGGGSLFDQPTGAREVKASDQEVRSEDQPFNASSSAVSKSSSAVSGNDIPDAPGHGDENSPSGAVQQQVQQQAQQQVPEQGKKGPGAVTEQGANDPGAATDTSGTGAPVTPLPGATGRDRKVSRVILFYDDNSFETFEPA